MTANSISAKGHVLSLSPTNDHALGMTDDGVVQYGDVPHLGNRRMGCGGNTGDNTVEDDVVAHQRIGDDLNSFPRAPDHIALNQIDLRSAAVDEDTGYWRPIVVLWMVLLRIVLP